MNKKKVIYLIALLLLQVNCAWAVRTIPDRVSNLAVTVNKEEFTEDNEEADIIKKVSFRDKFKRSPETQIANFFKSYNRYAEKNNIEKLKNMYSDSFANNDGFNKETIFKLMQMSADTYKEIKYTSDIQNIKVDGNYAVVKVHEIAIGETEKPLDKVGDNGIITSELYYTDYLRKEDNNWKILANVINYEKVDLKYGEAKNTNIDIIAPDYVPEGSEYEISMKADLPPEVFTIASIVNDPITFPQKTTKDAFKGMKKDELSRLVTANKDNNNEYATVSLAITRAKTEPNTLVLNMTGIAFSMKRVNVLHINNIKLEEEEKNAEETKG